MVTNATKWRWRQIRVSAVSNTVVLTLEKLPWLLQQVFRRFRSMAGRHRASLPKLLCNGATCRRQRERSVGHTSNKAWVKTRTQKRRDTRQIKFDKIKFGSFVARRLVVTCRELRQSRWTHNQRIHTGYDRWIFTEDDSANEGLTLARALVLVLHMKTRLGLFSSEKGKG